MKTKIGALLLLRGTITPEQLQESLSLQRNQNQNKPLGQILVELGYITKEELRVVLALQSGYSYININHCKMEPAVLSLIPEAMVKKYQVFPIDKIQDVLTIGMIDPLDKSAIEQIEKFTKCNVNAFLITPLELREMVSKYYGQKQDK